MSTTRSPALSAALSEASHSGNRSTALSEAGMEPPDNNADAYQSNETYNSDYYSSVDMSTVNNRNNCCASGKCKVKNPIHFVRNLSSAFGWQFLVMILCAYLFVKGALYTFIDVGKLPYFQSINVGGSDYQRLSIAASTPWAMKALFGAVSDAVPLCGYSKSVYIVFTAIVGTAAFALLATVELNQDSAEVAAAMFFFGSLELAVVDLLCEGRYAALMVLHPETGAGLVTWVWACYQIGTLIAAACIGPITDNWNVHYLFWICLPFSVQILIPTLLGYLREDPSGRHHSRSQIRQSIGRRKSSRLSTHKQFAKTEGSPPLLDSKPAYETASATDELFVAHPVASHDTAGEAAGEVSPSSYGTSGSDAPAKTIDVEDQVSDDAEPLKEAPAPKCLCRPESCPGSPCCVVDCSKIVQQKKLFILAVIMAVGSLGLSIVSLMDNDILQISYAAGISVALCVTAFFCLPRTLARVNLYMFLQDVLYVQIYGAMDYYYTADYSCLHDGPHFSYSFYSSWSNIVGAITGYLGVILFQTVMGKWNFRNVFWVTTIIRVLASILDIVIVERWNIAIGIPDEWMYMLGDNIIYQVCYMMNFMPAVVLTSKVCPESMEATVYALLAGFQNFGQFVAASVGVYMITAFGISIPSSEPSTNFTTMSPITTVASNYTGDCNFDNLPWLIAVCHCFLPILAIPLTFVLIPNAKLTDSLIVDENGTFTGVAASKATTEGQEVDSAGDNKTKDESGTTSTVRRRRRGRGPVRSKASSSLLATGAFIKRASTTQR